MEVNLVEGEAMRHIGLSLLLATFVFLLAGAASVTETSADELIRQANAAFARAQLAVAV